MYLFYHDFLFFEILFKLQIKLRIPVTTAYYNHKDPSSTFALNVGVGPRYPAQYYISV